MSTNAHKILITILLSSISFLNFAQTDSSTTYQVLSEHEWVDSVFNSLNTEEKIAQLIMIRAHSNKTKAYHEKIANNIKNQKVGGLCFFQGGPGRQINLVNYYQEISETPLLIAIDGEWGVGMRLDSSLKFPRQMTLGAIQNDSLIYQMGVEVAKQCKSVGVDMNFAPVADVNNNPLNPVINSRSFGENPMLVAQKASMYMKGMQSQHLLTCAKHFPGHGDTDSDSHETLPTVHANLNDLDSIHFSPFKAMIEEGIASVMVAHLFVPAIDSTHNRASTLSPLIVDSLLKKDYKFEGLAITDALEMKGVSDYFPAGRLEVMALQAGIDILLMPKDPAISIDSIKFALENGELDSTEIHNRVKKVLKYKYIAGLNQKREHNTAKAYETINSNKVQALNKQLYRNAITLIHNADSMLPLSAHPEKRTAIISVGLPRNNAFSKSIQNYRAADLFSIKPSISATEVQALAQRVKGYDYVILGILNTNNNPNKNYGIHQSTYELANLISQHGNLIINMHANPYAAGQFLESSSPKVLMISYQDHAASLEAAAEALMGGYDISGRLPVSINDSIKEGFGIDIKKKRLCFGLPEEIAIPSDSLRRVDSIIQSGIDAEAYPGCQVLIVKDGHVFYRKNFGHYTYRKYQEISDNTLYDLASITKVMATTLATMKLADEGKIDIDKRLKDYFPELDSTNKGNILIRDLLSHQARLKPWIPFYLHTLKNNRLDPSLFRTKAQPGFSTQVSQSLYVIDSYKDTIMHEIVESDLLKKKDYRYSDLGMYFMRRIIEQESGMSIDTFLLQNFYQPLGLQFIGYKPLERFPKKQITPTEEDNYFRFRRVQGYVHDQACALEGGIEGHAGLFSNSLDLAILSQMFLQNGSYADSNYIKTETLKDFTRQQFPLNDNRRGLGFDKPLPNHEEGGPTSPVVSSKSYGHSGFTGTYFWVDPEHQLTYIFLSNRTYPTAENRKLITMDIRTNIQEEIYRVLGINQ